MTEQVAWTAPRIFDGARWHEDAALLAEGAEIRGIVAPDDLRAEVPLHRLDGGMIVPGFVDLQVNGGGGILFNQNPSVDGIATICAAHARYGTTSLLPTLITDTPEVTAQAVAAGRDATGKVPAFLGLHLEGPHLSLARKGAHDPSLIRPMSDADLAALAEARQMLPNLLVTVAAETVTPDQIGRLVAAGITVSIGHSDAGYEAVAAAAAAGASMATHLFNAMSQLTNREPGVVGAVVDLGALSAGLIADGIHVHPATIGAALRAKRGPGRIFLVTDAMALTGSPLDSFNLNGRTVRRAGGALRLPDGTLAGADLTMIDAIRYMHEIVGSSLEEALRMATLYPAQALAAEARLGWLGHCSAADFVHVGPDWTVQGTWIGGAAVFRA